MPEGNERSAEFCRGAVWMANCLGDDREAEFYAHLLSAAEAREENGAKATDYRLGQLEAMNAALVRKLANIQMACQPKNLTGPDGRVWTFTPPDDLLRKYWETLSAAVREAMDQTEAREAGDRCHTWGLKSECLPHPVCLVCGEVAGDEVKNSPCTQPTAAEVIAAAEKALEKIEDIADGRLMRVQDRVADELALTDVANESRACLDVIVRYKEANHAK